MLKEEAIDMGHASFAINEYDIWHYTMNSEKKLAELICYLPAHDLLYFFFVTGKVPQSKYIEDDPNIGGYRNFMLYFEFRRYQEIIATFRYVKDLCVDIYWDDATGYISIGELHTAGHRRVGELEPTSQVLQSHAASGT
jgi:hypothetical protein